MIEKIRKKIAPEDQRPQSVVLKTFKWDFFLSLFTEGLIEILTNMAGHVLILTTVGYIKPYQTFLLITRTVIVISTIYFSTKFLWNKMLYDDKNLK